MLFHFDLPLFLFNFSCLFLLINLMDTNLLVVNKRDIRTLQSLALGRFIDGTSRCKKRMGLLSLYGSILVLCL